MATALDVFTEARMLLNDQGAKLYTNTILIPVLNKAYRELRQNFADNGVSTTKIQTAEITIPQAATLIESSATPPDPALPSGLLYPIKLHEKLVGQDDINYVEMTEQSWTPDVTAGTYRRYWDWRENTIYLPPATGIVEIRIRYWGELPVITAAGDDIEILDSLTFLAARTAAIAATTIGGMPTKGEIIQADANSALSVLLSTAVKNRQALPVRRRPFRAFRRGYFWGR